MGQSKVIFFPNTFKVLCTLLMLFIYISVLFLFVSILYFITFLKISRSFIGHVKRNQPIERLKLEGPPVPFLFT